MCVVHTHKYTRASAHAHDLPHWCSIKLFLEASSLVHCLHSACLCMSNQNHECLDSQKPWVYCLAVGSLEAMCAVPLIKIFWLVTVERACQESRTKKSSLPSNVSSEFELIFKGFDFLLFITLIRLSLSNNKGVLLHYLLLRCPNCSLSQSYPTDW